LPNWKRLIVSGSDAALNDLNLDGNLVVLGGATGSFTGSFTGDGTNLTGVTAEWDGSHFGDASITGSLAISGSGIDLTVMGGNVGIGTTSPGAPLEIRASASTPFAALRLSTSSTKWWQINTVFSNTNPDLFFAPNGGAATVTLQQDGDVGIGTTNPSAKLHVMAAETTATNLVVAKFTKTSTSPGNSGSTIVTIGNNNTATRTLDIEYNDMGGGPFRYGNYGDANIVNNTNGSGAHGSIHFITKDSSSTKIGMTIGGGSLKGNIGIGTTAPTEKLDVIGNIKAENFYINRSSDGSVVFQNSSVDKFLVGYDSSPAGLRFYDYQGTAGTRFFIESTTGNVGIGTITPAAKLDVAGDVIIDTTTPTLTLISDGGASIYNTVFESKYDSSNYWNIRQSGQYHIGSKTLNGTGSTYLASYYNLNFITKSTTADQSFVRMTVLQNGNVGIGTTSPTAKLEVKGTGTTSATTNLLLQNSAASTLMTVLDDGKVGIGTTTPAAKLDVAGDIKAGATSKLYFNTAVTFAGSPSGSNILELQGYKHLTLQTYNDAVEAQYISFAPRLVEAMRIIPGGNVGIGTTSPTNQLHIHSDTNDDFALRIEGSTNNASGVWTGIGIGGESSNTKAGLLFEDIGASYARGKLHLCVNNEANQNSATPANARLTISNDGNVGIGTTSPTAKLEISGDILINKANISNQENLDADIGIEVVAQVVIATYTAAFFDYVIKNGTNVRAGIVYACHDGTNVEFTETSTTDLGSTTDLVLKVDISAGNMRLLASAASDNWIVKTLVRAL